MQEVLAAIRARLESALSGVSAGNIKAAVEDMHNALKIVKQAQKKTPTKTAFFDESLAPQEISKCRSVKKHRGLTFFKVTARETVTRETDYTVLAEGPTTATEMVETETESPFIYASATNDLDSEGIDVFGCQVLEAKNLAPSLEEIRYWAKLLFNHRAKLSSDLVEASPAYFRAKLIEGLSVKAVVPRSVKNYFDDITAVVDGKALSWRYRFHGDKLPLGMGWEHPLESTDRDTVIKLTKIALNVYEDDPVKIVVQYLTAAAHD